jgi:hypothetical protein
LIFPLKHKEQIFAQKDSSQKNKKINKIIKLNNSSKFFINSSLPFMLVQIHLAFNAKAIKEISSLDKR